MSDASNKKPVVMNLQGPMMAYVLGSIWKNKRDLMDENELMQNEGKVSGCLMALWICNSLHIFGHQLTLLEAE